MYLHLQPKKSVNVALIIGSPIIHYGFRQLLKNYPNITICDECNDGLQGVKLLGRTTADIVIIDSSLRDIDVYEMVSRHIRRQTAERKTHILLHLDEQIHGESNILRYIRAGVTGIVSQNQPIADILKTINKTVKGERSIPPQLMQDCEVFREGINNELEVNLSSREQQVLKLIVSGQKSRHIAEKLSLSIKTVECHRANLRRKFNVNNVVDLINKGRYIGLC